MNFISPHLKYIDTINENLLSFLDVEKNYSISDFNKTAKNIISDIIKRNKTPLLVGASGLYILSLLYPYVFTQERDEDFHLLYQYTSNEDLWSSLKMVDPQEAEKLHANNRRRVLRALEIFYKTGKTKTELIHNKTNSSNYNFLAIELYKNQDIINEKIKIRVNEQFKRGFIDEVKKIIKKHPKAPVYNSFQSIGYKEVYDYIINNKEINETKKLIIDKTVKLSKKQKRFFKNKFESKFVFDMSTSQKYKEIFSLIKNFIK